MLFAAGAFAQTSGVSIQLDSGVISEGGAVAGTVASSAAADSLRVTWYDAYGDVMATTTVQVGAASTARFAFTARKSPTAISIVEAVGKAGSARAVFTMLPSADDAWSGFLVVLEEPPAVDGDTALMLRSLGARAVLADGAQECLKAAEAGLRPIAGGLVSPGALSMVGDDVSKLAQEYYETGDSSILVREPSLADSDEVDRLRQDAARRVGVLREYAPAGLVVASNPSVTNLNRVLDVSFGETDLLGFRRYLETRLGASDKAEMRRRSFPGYPGAVMPMTARGVVEEAVAEPDNPVDVALWALHREYMDGRFASTIHETARSAVVAASFLGGGGADFSSFKPPSGIVGALGPSAYGGWDYDFLAGLTDFAVMSKSAPRWTYALAVEMGLASKILAPLGSGSGDVEADVWNVVADGLAGAFVDKVDDLVASTVAAPTPDGGEPGPPGKAPGPLGRALYSAADVAAIAAYSRKTAAVAVVYNPESIRMGWILDHIARSGASASDPLAGTEALDAWTVVLKDVGVDFKWVSLRAVERGELMRTAYTMVVLPETWCLSRRAVNALSAYANAGGTVVADCAAGLFDETYRAYEQSPADALFGVTRDALTWGGVRGHFFGEFARVKGLLVADGALAAARRVQATSTDAGTVEVLNAVGSGGAVFLNTRMRLYKSSDEELRRSLKTTARLCLSAAGYVPEARVFQEDKAFDALVRERAVPGGSIIFVDLPGPQSGFDRTKPMEVRFQSAAYIYNMRPAQPLGEAFGYTNKVVVTPPRTGPVVLAKTDVEIGGMSLEVDFDGALIYARATLSSTGAPGERLFSVVLLTPMGRSAPQLAETVSAENGAALIRIPMPLNSPRGTWRVAVRDLLTGATAWADVVVP
jgi:hypothetical protein